MMSSSTACDTIGWLMPLHVAPPLGAAVVVVVVVVGAIVDVVVAFAPVAVDDVGDVVVVELVTVVTAVVAVVALAGALLTVDRSQLVALPLHGMHRGPCRREVSAGKVPAGHETHVSAPVEPSHCST